MAQFPPSSGGSGADASTTTKGVSKLSAAPVSASNPIALGANDPAVTDTRVPTDGSVTNAKVAANAAIAYSKLNLAGAVLVGDLAFDPATQAELNAHVAAGDPHPQYALDTDLGLYIPKALLTAKGSTIGASGNGVAVEIPGGANGKFYRYDTSQPGNIGWDAADLVRTGGFAPANAISETFRRALTNSTDGISSGVPRGTGIALPGGQAVRFLSFMTDSAAASGLTHTFFFLCDKNRVVLATTIDDTAATWAANTEKKLELATVIGGGTPGGSYTPATDVEVYLMIVCVGTGMPNLKASTSGASTAIVALAPILAGQSGTSGITTPASLPGTIAGLGALQRIHWGVAYAS